MAPNSDPTAPAAMGGSPASAMSGQGGATPSLGREPLGREPSISLLISNLLGSNDVDDSNSDADGDFPAVTAAAARRSSDGDGIFLNQHQLQSQQELQTERGESMASVNRRASTGGTGATLRSSTSGLASFAHLSEFLAEEGYGSRRFSFFGGTQGGGARMKPRRKRRPSLSSSGHSNQEQQGSRRASISSSLQDVAGGAQRPPPPRRASIDETSYPGRPRLDRRLSSFSLMSIGTCCSDLWDDAADHLDELANEAVKDFKLQLKYYGKESLDEEAFDMLLDDIGYKRCRDGLFDALLDEVSLVSLPPYMQQAKDELCNDSVHRKDCVTVQDMQNLYASEPYRLPQQAAFNNGEALMSYVENLFRKADTTGDNTLDRDELGLFLTSLFDDGREPTEAEVSEAMEALDVDGDGKIDFDEFKSFMLKANVNDTCAISSDFNEGLLSPSHTSEEEFVTELENYTKTHRAVTHHLLTNLACASFGKRETADMLLRFLSAYSHFNSGFITNVETLLGLLDNEEHIEVLQENLEEEMGTYDEETLEACEAMGIPREAVEGVTHRELFMGLVDFVETVLQRSYSKFIPGYICEKLNEAIEYAKGEGQLGLLAALYFGSELIVPQIYSSILQGLRNSIGVSNEDAKFLILHIDMDQDHAAALREIIVENCRTKADRLVLVKCTKMLLDARVSFYDSLIKYSSLDPMARDEMTAMYDDAAKKWIRSEPVNMADFTGRPVVFEMCKDHTSGSTVLDIGCGEGYVARKLVASGAAKVVGVDISSKMIEAAKTHPDKRNAEYYIEGDVANLKETLLRTTNKTNLMPGAQFDLGLFDLSVAVFLFNYVTITDMDKTFKDVFSLLKPGGHFVFSVPHPFTSNVDSEVFGFTQHESSKTSNYFALRDKVLDGHVSTISGERLKVKMYCKTFEDYVHTARKHGFEIEQMTEARVDPDHLNKNPAFFDSINGVPLHLIVKLRKPVNLMENNTSVVAACGNSSLCMLPKKLNWSRAALRNPRNAFVHHIPNQVKQELYKAALECFDRGISVDDLDQECDFPSSTFLSLKSFAVSLRNNLLHETGMVLLKGLDLDVFGPTDDEKSVACSKLAYYLICNHIGAVDGSARGRLFDVQDSKLDAMDDKNDNVLFSVSNCEANWHTDGASKDKVYDAVSLLCIHPSDIGGRSKVSNACNAYDAVSHMPKFILNELHRPVSRDILENGKGNAQHLSMSDQLSRADSIMSLRMSYNSYPIFDVQPNRMRFRYMRHWIESSHKKMHWKVPTLLQIAMDVLDDTLDEGCCFHERLERGDILICNNACVAHGRDSFQDTPGKQRRHLVRAWMQMQKVDLLKPSVKHGAL